ncbi:MAG: nucleoside triphosphate pyrophosphohydrolase [Limnochordaceae bacterium]|nr:nucleoside triphosphate pyrophosphohydrolase [Limnochordaceae bacterium]
MARLRAPDGCPWDRRQSPMSLRKYVIEEAYEVCDAIERDDMAGLEEELGDLLLQVLFQAQIADEQGLFDLAGVIERLRAKLVRRHPHVFGDATARTAAEVLQRWEAIKREERQEKGEPAAPSSRMDDVARALPALAYADAIQRKAAEVGFEWPDVSGAGRKAVEEALELRRAWADQDPDATHRELGDLLFAIVNVARYMHVDAELALRDAVHRFARRFRMVEEKAKEQGRILDEMSLEEMDALWDEAKRELQDAPERRRGGPAVRTDSGKLEKGGS